MKLYQVDGVVRLSSWVRFIESWKNDGSCTALHTLRHTHQQSIQRTSAPRSDVHGHGVSLSGEDRKMLMKYTRFRKLTSELERFVLTGLLVGFGEDPLSVRHAQMIRAARTPPDFCAFPQEAEILLSYEKAYWREEVESNRDYLWRGHHICKSPDDLFFYQELMTRSDARSVLEIGCDPGGSAQFFCDMFELSKARSKYVGIDMTDQCLRNLDDTSRIVEHSIVVGNACEQRVFDEAAAAAPVSMRTGDRKYDLVVIDAEAIPQGRIGLLWRYSDLVNSGGYIVVEDVCMADTIEASVETSLALDDFLMRKDGFHIVPEARRFLTGRALRAVFKRT